MYIPEEVSGILSKVNMALFVPETRERMTTQRKFEPKPRTSHNRDVSVIHDVDVQTPPPSAAVGEKFLDTKLRP